MTPFTDEGSAHSLIGQESTIRTRFEAPILSVALFAFLLAVFAASPVITSTDSRWAIHTAMSFAKGRGGDLTEYLPILAKEASIPSNTRTAGRAPATRSALR